MVAHRLLNDLSNVRLPGTGKVLYMESEGIHLLKWGAGAPSNGTLDAKYYLRTDPATGAHFYYNNGSAWVASD